MMANESKISSDCKALVSSIRVDHDAYREIAEEIERTFDVVGSTTTPPCIPVLGESRTGKTCVTQDVLTRHPPLRTKEGSIQTVVRAVTPPGATVKALVRSLLFGLGDPHWSRGTLDDQTNRLHTLLEAVRCKVIILDEFQHLCAAGQKHRLQLTSDWLKTFLEPNKYGLIVVGLPEAAAIINNNPQLRQRFDNPLRMPLFNWRIPSSANQFRGILRQFEQQLTRFELPPLTSSEMGLRMYLATAGRVGLIAKLLERAVYDAVRHASQEITIERLAKAYRRVIWGAEQFPVDGGPFGACLEKLSPATVQDAVLETAAQEPADDRSSEVSVHGERPDGSRQGGHKEPSNEQPACRYPISDAMANSTRSERKHGKQVKKILGRVF